MRAKDDNYNRCGGGRGGTHYPCHAMHGRSRMTIEPRIPTMTGRSTSRFHRSGRRHLHQARSAVRCSVGRMKGELHPSRYAEPLVRRSFLASGWQASNESICFPVCVGKGLVSTKSTPSRYATAFLFALRANYTYFFRKIKPLEITLIALL